MEVAPGGKVVVEELGYTPPSGPAGLTSGSRIGFHYGLAVREVGKPRQLLRSLFHAVSHLGQGAATDGGARGTRRRLHDGGLCAFSANGFKLCNDVRRIVRADALKTRGKSLRQRFWFPYSNDQ